LLKHKNALAGKPLTGSFGKGFVKFGFVNEIFSINNAVVSETSIRNSIVTWMDNNTGYLITEFIKAHSRLRQIWADTPSTIRISLLRCKHEPAKIVNAYIQFDSKKTGVIDNTGAGGVCRINYYSGAFGDGKCQHPKFSTTWKWRLLGRFTSKSIGWQTL